MCLKVVCNVGIIFLQMVAHLRPKSSKTACWRPALQDLQVATKVIKSSKVNPKKPSAKVTWTLQSLEPLITNSEPWGFCSFPPPSTRPKNCPATPVSALQSPCCQLSAWHRAPWLGRWMELHRKLTPVIPFFGGVWPSDLTWDLTSNSRDLSQRVFKNSMGLVKSTKSSIHFRRLRVFLETQIWSRLVQVWETTRSPGHQVNVKIDGFRENQELRPK